MGFDFNRSGGAGGKIRREVKRDRLGNLGSAQRSKVTDPYDFVNGTPQITSAGSAYNQADTVGQTLTFSAASDAWIDIAQIQVASTNFPVVQSIQVDGSDLGMPVFEAHTSLLFFLDIPGLGRSVQVNLDTAASIVLYTFVPQTIVSTGGSIIAPDHLTPYSVLFDVPP